MDNNHILIQPVPVETIIHHVVINMDDFKLNAIEGDVVVYQFDSTNRLLNVNRVKIEQSIYLEWGKDDNFIVDYALSQLGFQRL